MVLFPHAVDGDKQRNYHGEQGHIAQHDVPLLYDSHQAHAGNQPAGEQESHGENKEFGLMAELFGFPHSGPAVGKVICKAGGGGNHGQYHNDPVNDSEDGRQILLANQQNWRAGHDFRHEGQHDGARHGEQKSDKQADGDAGTDGILLAADLVGIVAQRGAPGRAGHAVREEHGEVGGHGGAGPIQANVKIADALH